mgnify:CR=1 FL=1
MTLVAEDILAKLDPKTRQRIQLATGVSAERQKTPSAGLNMALKVIARPSSLTAQVL